MKDSTTLGCHQRARSAGPGVAGADINATDEDGWSPHGFAPDYGKTPLHTAVMCNHPEVAKVLLANGAQVNARTNNARDDRGNTALALARMFQRMEMEALLLQHGAE